MIVTVRTGAPSAPGVHAISENSWEALVLTGSATRPTGAYRARSGMLTLTRMERGTMEGTTFTAMRAR